MRGHDLMPNKEAPRTNDATVWESDEKLIISLDFGTSCSGIAFCFASRRDPKVVSITNWPGANGQSIPKIPTILNYSPLSGGFTWGASAARKLGNIVGVKLLLDTKQEQPLYLPTGNIKQDLRKLPKPVVDVAADFISAIYEHALTEISKEVPEAYMAICKKEFVLSVPAVWSDAAKDATLQAAYKAGLSPVTLIKEPEAAALHTFHSLDNALGKGDAFIVCDAGGGTVDLISYEVEETHPGLKLKELVPGTGGRAGSLGLNQRFAGAVQNLVGDDQWYTLKTSEAFAHAERQFDREIKKAFQGDPEEEYFVNFPLADLEADLDQNFDGTTWRMKNHDVEDIFNPLISDIIRLISDQVKSVQIKRPNTGVTGILLVGGFGSSQYLKTCVEKANPDIKVLQPSDAWAAIVKGAALSRLPREASVVSTSATKHYGVEAHGIYDDHEDRGMRTYLDRYTGHRRVPQMTWYINIGDDLRRDQVIRFPFCHRFPTNYTPSDLSVSVKLFECSDPAAPRHRSKGHKIGPNCALHTNLEGIPECRFQKLIAIDGVPYFSIAYDLVLSIDSALMNFSLEFDGKKLGTVKANFG